MALPELDVARVQRWCAARVPEHARHPVRVECQVAPRHLTIVERRAPWREDYGPEWASFPIARLGYTVVGKSWTLYWRDRNLRSTTCSHRRTASTTCSTRSTATPPASLGLISKRPPADSSSPLRAAATPQALAADVEDLDWDEHSIWGSFPSEGIAAGDLMIHHGDLPLSGECPSCRGGATTRLCLHMASNRASLPRRPGTHPAASRGLPRRAGDPHHRPGRSHPQAQESIWSRLA